MAVLIVPNITRVSVLGNQADGQWANVFALNRTGASTSISEGAQTVLDAYIEHLLPVLTSTITSLHAHFTDLSSATGASGDLAYTGAGVNHGAVNVDPLPPQCSYLIHCQGSAGRGQRSGRFYPPGVRKDEVSNSGDITSGTQTTVGNAADAFLEAVATGGGGNLHTIHHPKGGAVTTSLITYMTCEAAIATQRRRLNR